MPQAIPIIVEVAAAYFGGSQLVYAIVAVVLMYAASQIQKKPSGSKMPINVTLRSTIAERVLILGEQRVGGAMMFAKTSGTKNKYLWYVIAYAGHQCNALKDAWLDQYNIPAADINGSTGSVATANMYGKLKIWDHLGTGAQTADSTLDAEFTEWTSNHRLRGICYRVIRFERDDKAFPTGAPQSISARVEGALLYDPRLDSTNGGSGSHRRDNPSTWAYSRNWALGVRWYLSGGSVVNDQSTRLIRYGVQESDSRIDDAYFTAAANVADQSVSGANAPPSGAQARYTLDMVWNTSETRRDVLEDMLVAGGPGQLAYLHGKWRLYAAAYDSPTLSFSQDDLVGEIEVEDTSGDEERFNQITGIYTDESREWTEQTTPVRFNSAYTTQDGGRDIQREISLRGCSNQYRAQRLVELYLRASRQFRRVVFRFGRQGMRLAPWETFSFTHTRYGWSSRVFRVVEREIEHEIERQDDGGLVCKITARAESSAVYTDLVTADYSTGTSVTNALQSEPPDEPTNLVAQSIDYGIRFTWDLGAFWLLNGTIELWEYTANTPFASATKIWEGAGTTVTINKDDTTTRYYWIRTRARGGQTSSTEPATNGLAGTAIVGALLAQAYAAGPYTRSNIP